MLSYEEFKERVMNEFLDITMFPDTDGCEGFFICRMERDKKDKD